MIRMKALGYQKYEGVAYRNGDIIPVKNEADASDLAALNLAQRIPVAAVLAPPPAYESRDVAADAGDAQKPAADEAVAAVESKAPKKGGRYGHREMRVGR